MSAIPLVLLNAFPADKEQWEPLLALLEDSGAALGDIITFDPPGIGDMPATDEMPSLDLIADAAVVAMREVTGSKAALWVGCSMGGYIAMAVLERHADAVAGLGLLGTRATVDAPEGVQRRLEAATAAREHDGLADPSATAKALLGVSSHQDAALLAAITANLARQHGNGIAWGQEAMASRPGRLDVLEGSDIPAFVARGVEDTITSVQDAEAMARALGVQALEVEAAGHLLATEKPEVVAALIFDLARSLD